MANDDSAKLVAEAVTRGEPFDQLSPFEREWARNIFEAALRAESARLLATHVPAAALLALVEELESLVSNALLGDYMHGQRDARVEVLLKLRALLPSLPEPEGGG